MSKTYRMRFTGSGGQGVILASVILAEAAVIDGRNTIQSQAYGPEARGGTSKAETIVSDEPIGYSKITRPDFLLALTQGAADKFCGELADKAVVMLDDTLETPASIKGGSHRVLALPILSTARDKIGKAMTANIVAVGAINGALDLFSEDVIREAVRRHIPAGTEDLNMRALAEGKALAARS